MINFEKKLQDLKNKTEDLGRAAQRIKKIIDLLKYQRDFAVSKWTGEDQKMRNKVIAEFNQILDDSCK